jgi:serine/threonine protein phosphatase PrpC
MVLQNNLKPTQEAYLLSALNRYNPQGDQSECDLASKLVEDAIMLGSRDNVSVAIQTITQETQPFIAAVFDGHGGPTVSSFAARWLGVQFERLCLMSENQYQSEEEFSVARHHESYQRDNKETEEKFSQHISLKKPESDLVLLEDSKSAKESKHPMDTQQKLTQALLAYFPNNILPDEMKNLENLHKILWIFQKEKNLKDSICAIAF